MDLAKKKNNTQIQRSITITSPQKGSNKNEELIKDPKKVKKD
jgi:hypothetical protein